MIASLGCLIVSVALWVITHKSHRCVNLSVYSFPGAIFSNYFRTIFRFFNYFFIHPNGQPAVLVHDTSYFFKNKSDTFNSNCYCPNTPIPIQSSKSGDYALFNRSVASESQMQGTTISLLRHCSATMLRHCSANSFHSQWLASGLFKPLQFTLLTRSL